MESTQLTDWNPKYCTPQRAVAPAVTLWRGDGPASLKGPWNVAQNRLCKEAEGRRRADDGDVGEGRAVSRSCEHSSEMDQAAGTLSASGHGEIHVHCKGVARLWVNPLWRWGERCINAFNYWQGEGSAWKIDTALCMILLSSRRELQKVTILSQ